MASRPLIASSSTEGFFQDLPVLVPQYTYESRDHTQNEGSINSSDDAVFARILALYLPEAAVQVKKHVHDIARIALHPRVLAYSVDAEINHPSLRPLSTFGRENKNDPLWTTAGWKALKEIGYQEGVVAVAYEKASRNWNRRIHEFSLGHIWTVPATMTGCPMSMTDGAATLLGKHLEDADGDQPGRREVLQEAYRRLTSRDPKLAWTSGQWMTERSGGSDVSRTETIAQRLSHQELRQELDLGRGEDAHGMPLGPWKIDGFKWFSSATDSEMAVLLARTARGGLSAFYIPMRRRIEDRVETPDLIESTIEVTELNGIRIQRLKNKLGTKAVPTAELELKGTRGWLIGTEGQGVKEVSAILNITRLSTAAGSVANWSRGLAICRAYTQVRKVRGGLLQENPAHLRWMADETVKYWAAAHFLFFEVALQGVLEQDWDEIVKETQAKRLLPKSRDDATALLRLLTPILKAQVSVASVNGLRECMECLGGVGYCENNEDGGLLNIARIYRDNLVNPIWEGTVSVMAEDVVRVLVDKRLGGGDVLGNLFQPWAEGVLSHSSTNFSKEQALIQSRLEALKVLTQRASKEELLYRGRRILQHIEVIVCGCLLIFDATVSKDEDRVAEAIASRWAQANVMDGAEVSQSSKHWDEKVQEDKAIFLGRKNRIRKRQEKL